MAEVIELNVRLDCAGCKRKVEQCLLNVKGVDLVEVDMKAGKVKVTTCPGMLSAKEEVNLKKKLVKTVRNKAGKSAELAMPPSVVGYNPYVKTSQKFKKTYNYDKHLYNNLPSNSNVLHPSSVLPIQNVMLFSDENPNSCTIM